MVLQIITIVNFAILAQSWSLTLHVHQPLFLKQNDMLSLRFKSFVERPGGNFCWQGPIDWLLWVHEKVAIYTPSAKLKVFHYTKQ